MISNHTRKAMVSDHRRKAILIRKAMIPGHSLKNIILRERLGCEACFTHERGLFNFMVNLKIFFNWLLFSAKPNNQK